MGERGGGGDSGVKGTLAVTVRPQCCVDSNSGSVFSRQSNWYR
jgi:hypothetical protein